MIDSNQDIKISKIFTVIVTYNGMDWIQECLDSVIADSTVIVIDNLSTDQTVSFISEHYKDVIVLQQEANLGFGKANNVGIKYALEHDADYILLLNQDAKLEQKALQSLTALFEGNKDYGIISPIHCDWSGQFLESSFAKYMNYRYNEDFYSDFVLNKQKKEIYEVPFIAAACWYLPAHVFKKVGGFDPIFFHLGEDVNFTQRLLFHGFKIGVDAQSKVCHDTKERVYKPMPRFSDAYFYKLNYKEKIVFADINNSNWKSKIKYKRKQVLKDALFLLLQLKISKFRGALKEYRIFKNIEKDCELSRSKNTELGSHYLN